MLIYDVFHSSCSVNWETQNYNATSYIVFLFMFGLFLPVNVIIYSYIRIIKTMRDNALRSGRLNKAENRVTSMVFVMTIGEFSHLRTISRQRVFFFTYMSTAEDFQFKATSALKTHDCVAFPGARQSPVYNCIIYIHIIYYSLTHNRL